MKAIGKTLLTAAAVAVMTILSQPAGAAEDAATIERQNWIFSGVFGQFDQAQLQRGYQVYTEVCANCHEMKRIYYRNLAQKGGPEFPEEAVKALAAGVQVEDGPNEDGQMFQRPGKLTDRLPLRYKNEQEARSIHNGAYPPDLSLMARARNVEYHGPVWFHPLSMLRDVLTGYQEGGADYIYALLTGYTSPPATVTMVEGMHYNQAFPGQQIAMANPFAGGDGQVSYTDGTPATVDNYARDVSAFLSWAADPKLEDRKQLGWQVMAYLLFTTILLYIAKKRIWAKIEH
jgi:ubiquinol-cytochrome c reductase cytochrome c1 subunit